MRLTLRTLLAYMDDILEPADHEELTKKIKASEFAADLIHRTQDTTRRLRLSAPQVVGTGIGFDPNSVAEYLDNTLAPESVADFERICLESDMHLAEVVSCHHVLTMVLGEPAEIDPHVRKRMYQLPTAAGERQPARMEPTHVVSTTAAGTTGPGDVGYDPVVVASFESRRDAEIPDYLRAARWSFLRTVFALAAASLLIAVALLLVFGWSGLFGPGNADVAQQRGAGESELPPTTGSPEQGMAEAFSTAADEQGSSQVFVDTESESGGDGGPDIAEMLSGEPGDADATADREVPSAPLPPDEGSPLARSRLPDDQAFTPDEPVRQGSRPPAENIGSVTPDPDRVAMAADGADRVGPGTAVDGAATTDEEPGASADEGPSVAGIYFGGDNILLRYNAADESWYRLGPQANVAAGDRLLALPLYRPQISLRSGVDLTLGGGTLVEARVRSSDTPAASDAMALPTSFVRVEFGRVFLVNTAAGESTVQLDIGSTDGAVRLKPHATLAVDVNRLHVPGRDSRQSPAPVMAKLYAIDGGVTWVDDKGETAVDGPMQWNIVDGVAVDFAPLVEVPPWIQKESMDRIEELAVTRIEQRFTGERPARIQLQEIYYEGRRPEDRSLAARSSVYVGSFGPFVEALRDSDQRNAWESLITTLRSAMALSPDYAERVWAELVKQRGQDAATDLYEMLSGYSSEEIGHSPEELRSGVLVKLIDWLEHDSLDYRVLAFHNLAEITGRTQGYEPAARAANRQRWVRNWRQRLEDGEIESRVP